MAQIRIQVGASADQSMRFAFKPLVAAAVDARRQILREFAQVPKEIVAAMAGLARAQGGAFKGATDAARAAYKEQVAAARQAAKEQAAAAREGERMAAAAERERVQNVRRAEREIRQEHAASARERARAEREAAQSARAALAEVMANRRRFAQMTSYNTTRFLTPHVPVASVARRAMSEVVRGFGVDPTLSGAMQRNIQLETLAQQASNSASLAGQNVAPGDVEARIREVANKRGVSRTEAGRGVFSFQKLTGDLGMGLEMLDAMVARSAATATNIDDFAQAMGNASNTLGDMPNKGQVLLDVMDAITVQGARGAVEVSDLATHMARVAAASTAFSGDRAHGIKVMGAFAQLARAEGGAPSAAEAARSVVGFANTFQKSARLRAFESITGKSAFTDDTKTQLRPAMELVKDALLATGGNREKMNQIFMDAIGARAVKGFANAFTGAGGGQAGLAAVDAKLDHFMKQASLEQEKVESLATAREQTTAAKAQRFQNQLDDIAKRVQERLLPALEQAAPTIIKFVSAMGDLLAWALTNPGKAIVGAILFSLARAGLEAGARAAIEKGVMSMFARAFGSGAAGGAVGGGRGGGAGGRFLPLGLGGPVGIGVAAGLTAASVLTMGAITEQGAAEGQIDAWGKTTAELMGAAADPSKVDNKKREKLRRNVQDKLMQLDEMDRLASVGASAGAVFGEIKKGNFGFALDAYGTNLGRVLGTSSHDMKRASLVDSLAKDQANLATLRANPYQDPSKNSLERYVAKDSKTTDADMRAALARGGIPELEKIATLQSKQQTVDQQMLEEQKNAVGWLRDIHEKLPAGSPGTDPSVDPNDSGHG